MNKKKKVKHNYKEEIVKEDLHRISKDENLIPYTKTLSKNKLIVKIKGTRTSINYNTLIKICELSEVSVEEAVVYSFYQGNIDDDGISMSTKSINSNLQIPQYSNTPINRAPVEAAPTIISIPRKLDKYISNDTTKDNYVGNYIEILTRVWYCIYPIYIIIATLHLIHLIVYYIIYPKFTILPCESAILCITILNFFVGTYGLIKFIRNDIGDFSLINITLIMVIFLSLYSIIIPHFESYIGTDMYTYLRKFIVFIWILYPMMIIISIMTILINSKVIKFYTDYHKRCSEKEILLSDMN